VTLGIENEEGPKDLEDIQSLADGFHVDLI
jgi:hypothetical protein